MAIRHVLGGPRTYNISNNTWIILGPYNKKMRHILCPLLVILGQVENAIFATLWRPWDVCGYANLFPTCFGTWVFHACIHFCGNLEKIKHIKFHFKCQKKTCTQNKHTSYMSCTSIIPKLHDMLKLMSPLTI